MTCGGECPFRSDVPDRMLRCAVRYAELGYAVYPASQASQAQHRAMGKFERGFGGFKIASSNPLEVQTWAPVLRQRDVALGMATGGPSRLVVIDFDLKPKAPEESGDGSVSGEAMFELDQAPVEDVRGWARERDVIIPGNVQVGTPSGGLHVWMRTSTSAPRRIRWRDNVDLLWDKHSIKVPPSARPATERKPGGEYRFTRGCPCEVPEASEELVRALIESPSTGRVSRPGRAGTAGTYDPDADSSLDGPRVDIETPRRLGIPVGQQNAGLWDMACSYAGRGLPPSQAIQALVETVQASDEDPSWPWELEDLSDMVERAYMWKASERASMMSLASKITQN